MATPTVDELLRPDNRPDVLAGFAVAAQCDVAALALAKQLRLTPSTRGGGKQEKSAADGAFLELDEIAKRRQADNRPTKRRNP